MFEEVLESHIVHVKCGNVQVALIALIYGEIMFYLFSIILHRIFLHMICG